ncbi:hypothetical protein CERSUDRAFT_112745 [Gelatoporia subvermispora B]|uniref:2',3'-cyclic-nucleotide 3'-phosphodiesterase n=1 Tax=Ceriporiopsis subvermispora (strain B) TaxID=914234 RepID=M2R3F7_CERS8|nr:hypothetical protein CERSUDRAFT_112745 [Gelatoporia subvermispora B]
MGLSLWLVPSAEQLSKLKDFMQYRSPDAHSSSSFPAYDPHLTLASIPSSMSVSDLLDAIPHDQTIVPIRFKSVDFGEKYFMSVYVAVHHTPELESLRTHLRERLRSQAVPTIPHMSLYYIDDSDREEREKTVHALWQKGWVVAHDGGVSLNWAGESSNVLAGFDGAEIWAVRCEGPVHEWQVVSKISLCSF